MLAMINLCNYCDKVALNHNLIQFQAKMVVDYGLLTGTGRVALFGDLDSNEYQELCEKYCVVKFE